MLEFAGRRGLRAGGCVRASVGDGTFELSPVGAVAGEWPYQHLVGVSSQIQNLDGLRLPRIIVA